jgi:tetratricopeptide (TPR) repeat protein
MAMDDPVAASAIRRLEDRLARDPTSLAFAHLADLYRKAGRVQEALTLCRQGLARYPQYVTARLILARICLEDGQLESALEELRTILATSPRDAPSHRLASEVHRRLGNVDAAVEHLETAVTLEPADREGRSLLALLRASPAGTGEAAGLARVLRDDTFVTLAFGAVALDQGCVEEAAQVFTRLLRKDPNNLEARERLEQTLRARSRRKG